MENTYVCSLKTTFGDFPKTLTANPEDQPSKTEEKAQNLIIVGKTTDFPENL
jgi:hypothetical protein